MTESTANKLVMFFLVGGVVFALVRKGKSDTQQTYKRIWGTALLSMAGAAMAGFIPQIVGPFFLLVILAYASGHLPDLSKGVSKLESKASGAKGAQA